MFKFNIWELTVSLAIAPLFLKLVVVVVGSSHLVFFEETLCCALLMDCHQVAFVWQKAHHLASVNGGSYCLFRLLSRFRSRRFRSFLVLDNILNAAKNDDLLERVTICYHTHSVIAYVVKFVAIVRKFYFDPNFLIKKEEIYVIQQWGDVFFAKGIVASTSDYYCTVYGKIAHCMAEPRTGRITRGLDVDKLTLHYLAVHCHWFEIPKLVCQFSICLLSTEIVYSILNSITLKIDFLYIFYLLF